MLYGLNEITPYAEGVIDDQRDSIVVGNFGKCRDVIDNIFWIRNAFDENRFGLVVDSCGECFW